MSLNYIILHDDDSVQKWRTMIYDANFWEKTYNHSRKSRHELLEGCCYCCCCRCCCCCCCCCGGRPRRRRFRFFFFFLLAVVVVVLLFLVLLRYFKTLVQAILGWSVWEAHSTNSSIVLLCCQLSTNIATHNSLCTYLESRLVMFAWLAIPERENLSSVFLSCLVFLCFSQTS